MKLHSFMFPKYHAAYRPVCSTMSVVRICHGHSMLWHYERPLYSRVTAYSFLLHMAKVPSILPAHTHSSFPVLYGFQVLSIHGLFVCVCQFAFKFHSCMFPTNMLAGIELCHNLSATEQKQYYKRPPF